MTTVIERYDCGYFYICHENDIVIDETTNRRKEDRKYGTEIVCNDLHKKQ